MSRAMRVILVCMLAAMCAACAGGSPAPRAAEQAVVPKTFAATTTMVPAGFREVWCPIWRGRARGLTVRLVVPQHMTGGEFSGEGCGFSAGSVRGVGVNVAPAGTLAAWRKQELDPFDGVGGDDEVGHISYRAGVPGLDGKSAERLTWWSYDDGLPFWQTTIQSAGIGLTWSTPDGKDADLDTVRRSVGVERGVHMLCPFWGRSDHPALAFTPPSGNETVQREGNHCQIYFDGSPTVLQSAAVHPFPASLAGLARRLRHDPEVTGLRLRRGVARLAGRPADRLTWTVVRTHETKHYEPAGTWQIVVTRNARASVRWGQTPEWWQAHQKEYDDLVASVHVHAVESGKPSSG